jgi:hypothetical protein
MPAAAAVAAAHRRHAACAAPLAGGSSGRAAPGNHAGSAADQPFHRAAALRAALKLGFRHLLPPFETMATGLALVLVCGHSTAPQKINREDVFILRASEIREGQRRWLPRRCRREPVFMGSMQHSRSGEQRAHFSRIAERRWMRFEICARIECTSSSKRRKLLIIFPPVCRFFLDIVAA